MKFWFHCFEKPVRKVVIDLSLRLTPLTAESEEVVGGPVSLQFTQQHLIGSRTMSPAELRVVLLILGFLVTDSTLGDPCVTHTILDQSWRSTDCSHTECTGGQWMSDGNLTVGWYRFNSSGGWKIPETVVPQGRCSGETPGWLNGSHPNVGEGEVTRTVCFTWDKNTCYQRREIRVKNCSGYFVYWLCPTPPSYAVYCTEPLSDSTQERQGSVTGEPGPGLTTSTAGSLSSDLEVSTMDQPDGSSTGQPTPSPSSVSVGERSSGTDVRTIYSTAGGVGAGLVILIVVLWTTAVCRKQRRKAAAVSELSVVYSTVTPSINFVGVAQESRGVGDSQPTQRNKIVYADINFQK